MRRANSFVTCWDITFCSAWKFLIAADIIDTLMKPTPQDLLVLGAIIVIRTVISFSLNAELKSDQQHRAASS